MGGKKICKKSSKIQKVYTFNKIRIIMESQAVLVMSYNNILKQEKSKYKQIIF